MPDIEPFATPPDLALACTGNFEQVVIELPCEVGFNLVEQQQGLGAHAVECKVSEPAVGTLVLIVGLTDSPLFLGRPHDISEVINRVSPPNSNILVNGESYNVASIEGTVIFSSVEPRRAFVAQFQDLTLNWEDSSGQRITCRGTDAPFWAIPGNFL